MASYNEIDNRLSILEDYVDNIDTSISPLSESETKELLVYVALENTYGLDAEYFEKEYQSLVEAGVSNVGEIYKKGISDNINIFKNTISEAKKLKKSGDGRAAAAKVDEGIRTLQKLKKEVKDIKDYGFFGWVCSGIVGSMIYSLTSIITNNIAHIGGKTQIVDMVAGFDANYAPVYQSKAIKQNGPLGRFVNIGYILTFIHEMKIFIDNIKEGRQLGQIFNSSRTNCIKYIDRTIIILKGYKKFCLSNN